MVMQSMHIIRFWKKRKRVKQRLISNLSIIHTSEISSRIIKEEVWMKLLYVGNINWNDDYSYFCDFISKSLCEQPIFTAAEKDGVILIMSYLKKCGI